ncbi:MAG: exodeoxyribonuclease VII large subunit, partial [Betaproteobacteria bacterium]|nr:exodeoxyribonuclease VII large subunit [Betaproteobacteria bacterium]
ASGHCYFTLKDEGGQIRCAMFRRAAGLLDFVPRDGELVEVRGRLGLYEARGDVQLVVESMERAGQGALFEQFLRIKAQLEAQGLFDVARKRPLPAQPRAIGVVTSAGAAAWHDVMTALQRRVPHIPVRMAPALVQGSGAAGTLAQALLQLYAWTAEDHPSEPPIDVILLVRGGGAIDDLWAFNDPQLAQVIAQSPVPVISGVGHETDFTIADFVADVRAPTPTAAAEMAATARDELLQGMQALAHRLAQGVLRQLDRQAQRLDTVTARLSRPQAMLARQAQAMDRLAHRLTAVPTGQLAEGHHRLARLGDRLQHGLQRQAQQHRQRNEQVALRLAAVDPQRVLERGYAWLSDESGHALTRTAAFAQGQAVQATLADGSVPLVVR